MEKMNETYIRPQRLNSRLYYVFFMKHIIFLLDSKQLINYVSSETQF